jgi:hypothetical protein
MAMASKSEDLMVAILVLVLVLVLVLALIVLQTVVDSGIREGRGSSKTVGLRLGLVTVRSLQPSLDKNPAIRAWCRCRRMHPEKVEYEASLAEQSTLL